MGARSTPGQGAARGALFAVTCLALGGVAGSAALLLHQYAWGFALGVAASAAVWWALGPRWWGRTPFSAGWVVVAFLGSSTRPEGDFLVPANLPGYAFLGWSLTLVVASVVTWPTRTRRRVRTEGVGSAP